MLLLLFLTSVAMETTLAFFGFEDTEEHVEHLWMRFKLLHKKRYETAEDSRR
jgi:hypothetical protein